MFVNDTYVQVNTEWRLFYYGLVIIYEEILSEFNFGSCRTSFYNGIYNIFNILPLFRIRKTILFINVSLNLWFVIWKPITHVLVYIAHGNILKRHIFIMTEKNRKSNLFIRNLKRCFVLKVPNLLWYIVLTSPRGRRQTFLLDKICFQLYLFFLKP